VEGAGQCERHWPNATAPWLKALWDQEPQGVWWLGVSIFHLAEGGPSQGDTQGGGDRSWGPPKWRGKEKDDTCLDELVDI
jgi:hypothetical protein